MLPKKYQRLINFLEKNKISEKRALRFMEYFFYRDKNSGGRPRQKHYLYIRYRIYSILMSSKKPMTNNEAIKHYIESGMADQDYKDFNIKKLNVSSYVNILSKINNSSLSMRMGLGSFFTIPPQYKKRTKKL